MYTVIITYKISKMGILSAPISRFLDGILYRFLTTYICPTTDRPPWWTTCLRWRNFGLTAMSNGQKIQTLVSPTADSGNKPVSFTKAGARGNVANVAFAIGNTRLESRPPLPKPCAQNLAQKDDDRVAFQGQHLTNPMFSRVNGQTAFRINFAGNCASCFRCPMTAYNACSKTTWRTNPRKERWLLG